MRRVMDGRLRAKLRPTHRYWQSRTRGIPLYPVAGISLFNPANDSVSWLSWERVQPAYGSRRPWRCVCES